MAAREHGLLLANTPGRPIRSPRWLIAPIGGSKRPCWSQGEPYGLTSPRRHSRRRTRRQEQDHLRVPTRAASTRSQPACSPHHGKREREPQEPRARAIPLLDRDKEASALERLGTRRGVECQIQVKNPNGVCKGVKSVTVNGQKIDGSAIPYEAGTKIVKVDPMSCPRRW